MERDGYIESSRQLLEQAREELAAGDLLQASEKLWGAAAHMVKAVAERRGWSHDSHRQLNDAVNRLAQQTDDPELRRLFAYAQALHTNFYENWQPKEFVDEGSRTVSEFMAKLNRL